MRVSTCESYQPIHWRSNLNHIYNLKSCIKKIEATFLSLLPLYIFCEVIEIIAIVGEQFAHIGYNGISRVAERFFFKVGKKYFFAFGEGWVKLNEITSAPLRLQEIIPKEFHVTYAFPIVFSLFFVTIYLRYQKIVLPFCGRSMRYFQTFSFSFHSQR